MKQYKYECRDCGSQFTEAELNNKFECPVCGSKSIITASEPKLAGVD